jgi:glycosyltransferase involved in cell wall biosynthesis
MPVFNRETLVENSIRSILEQDFTDFELLMVDDGSSDRTPEVLRSWSERDARINVVTAPTNLGVPGALNLGLSRVRAPYVARLDSDDLMMPRRLAAQLAVLQERPDVVLASCAYESINPVGQLLGIWPSDEPSEAIPYLLNFYNAVGGGGQVMFRRDEVLAEGGFELKYPGSEDYGLWVRLLRRGRILSLPFIGMKKLDHAANSLVQYGAIKRANWTGIMRNSLTHYLQREIRDEEIEALITLWRHDGKLGKAAMADSVMREAFAKFRAKYSDPQLRRFIRERTARQWMDAADRFAKGGHRREAAFYALRAAGWNLSIAARRFQSTIQRH